MQEDDPSVEDLETFFKSVKLPKTIQLGPGETITDVEKFVASHLATIKSNPNGRVFHAFYDRLLKLKGLLSE